MPAAVPFIVAAAAIGGTAVAVANYEQGQSAMKAQKDLAAQQEAQLQQQQQEASAQAAQQAGSGSNFGWGGDTVHRVATGLGFGAASSQAPNTGRASLTGF